jgi:hypothetical protein
MFGLPVGLFTYASAAGGGNDPSFANVKLLCHFNGANGATTTVDSSGSPANMTMTNGAVLSNAWVQFGNASLFLDGTNDYVTSNRNCTIGAGAFTFEGWVRPTGNQTGRMVSSQDVANTPAVIFFRVNAGGSLTGFLRNSNLGGVINATSNTGLVPMNNSAARFVALTRDANSTITVWCSDANGLCTAVASNSGATDPGPNPYLFGTQSGVAEFMQGYLDDWRITEGVCRYTASFNAPTSQFPDS